MENQTKLITLFINPTILNAINQPLDDVEWLTYQFTIVRKGKSFLLTFYSEITGKISISHLDDNPSSSTIIQDYCKTLDDFIKLIEKLDDLIERMP